MTQEAKAEILVMIVIVLLLLFLRMMHGTDSMIMP